jgi:membrane protein implicated in regulation of membrane protease activity
MNLPVEVWWVWMAVGIVLILAEIAIPGFFILWFGVGAVVAGLLALIGFGTAVQWVTFLVVSGVLLVLSRRIADRITKRQPPGVGANRLVGMRGPVTTAVDNLKGVGQVRLGGELWRAESRSGRKIPESTVVEVVAVEGTHVVVREVEKEA